MTTTCDYCGKKTAAKDMRVCEITWTNRMKGHNLVVCPACLIEIKARAERVIDERDQP